MTRLLVSTACCVMIEVAAVPLQSAGAQDIESKRVSFARGADGATLSDTIRGDEIVDYLLSARAGQTMTINLASSNSSNYFNVTAPGASSALHIGSIAGNRFEGTLPIDGDYTIRVFLMRNAARRDEQADYTIDFRITEARRPLRRRGRQEHPLKCRQPWRLSATAIPRPVIPADASARVPRRSIISMTAPSSSAAPTPNPRLRTGGRIVDTVGGISLVSISTGDANAGLAASATATDSGGESDDALVPGTNYHAVAEVQCGFDGAEPSARCEAGVIRRWGSDGTTLVEISKPDGIKRAIFFRGTTPYGADSAEADGSAGWDFKFSRRDDQTLIEYGPESYVIVDAFVIGG